MKKFLKIQIKLKINKVKIVKVVKRQIVLVKRKQVINKIVNLKEVYGKRLLPLF